MTSVRILVIFLLVCSVSFAAESEATWRALSDTHMAPSASDVQARLEGLSAILLTDVEAMGNATPAASSQSAMSAEMIAQMRDARDQTLAAFEKQLSATDETKEPARYKQLKDAIETTRSSYANLLGETASPTPQRKTGSTITIPAFGNAIPSFTQALANLRRLLAMNSSAEAIAAFHASEDYSNAARCAGSAAAAVMMRRDMAALAAWLRAHELEPDNPHHLLNLAGLALRHSLPRHALALTDAAEARLKNRPAERLPLNPRAQLLSQRGLAQILLRKPVDAEKSLREALALEPQFSEAQINLAYALYQQNSSPKKEEGLHLLAVARHHTPPPAKPGEVAESAPVEETASADAAKPQTPSIPEEPKHDRAGRPLARDVFDLSHGKAGSLPTLRIPQTIADAHATWPAVHQFKAEISSENDAVTNRLLALSAALRKRMQTGDLPRLSYERAQDVFWYITASHFEPELRPYFAAWTKAMHDPGIGISAGQYDNPFGSKELADEMDNIDRTCHDYRARCRRLYDLTETFHASWLQPIHRLDTEVNRYARRYYVHATAIAANLSDPMCHEYAMLLVRSHMLTLTMSFLQPLEVVCRYHHQNLQDWGLFYGEGTKLEPVAVANPDADWCPAGLRGDYSVGLNLELFSIAINCEKVGIEFSAGEWIKGFLAVDQMFDGSGTFFVGVAGESSVPVVGALGISAAVKGGLYLSVDKNGDVSDFGLMVSRTSSVGVGPVSYSREIGNSFSFVAALSD